MACRRLLRRELQVSAYIEPLMKQMQYIIAILLFFCKSVAIKVQVQFICCYDHITFKQLIRIGHHTLFEHFESCTFEMRVLDQLAFLDALYPYLWGTFVYQRYSLVFLIVEIGYGPYH